MSRLVGVTGASGHLGGALARRFLESGDRVRAFCHRDLRAIEGLDLEAEIARTLGGPSTSSPASSGSTPAP